ncbi:hypothetical protein NF212_06310 [Parasalinivibrio latis]|uniref:hypothetical protein n=1 Tax=Parasalinivibrio latis TaxID=2952610 RepID=UPI0030E15234
MKQLTTLNQLRTLEKEEAIELLTDISSIRPLLDAIRTEASSEVPDVETRKGRERIGALALKVSKSKTTLVDSINGLIASKEDQIKRVKATRKQVEDELNSLRREVLKPRTEWEAEQARQEAEARDAILARIENIRQVAQLKGTETKDELTELSNAINDMPVDAEQFGEMISDALTAKQDALQAVNDALIERVKQDAMAEQVRLARITLDISSISSLPSQYLDSTKDEVLMAIIQLEKTDITEAEFGDKVEEAISAKNAALRQLKLIEQHAEDAPPEEDTVMVEIEQHTLTQLQYRSYALSLLEDDDPDIWDMIEKLELESEPFVEPLLS